MSDVGTVHLILRHYERLNFLIHIIGSVPFTGRVYLDGAGKNRLI